MKVVRNCQAKKFYDTEFEAVQAAARSSAKFDTDLAAYRCSEGSHWHVGNTDWRKRSRYREDSKSYCEVCETYMKSNRYDRHVTMAGHLARLRKRERDPK